MTACPMTPCPGTIGPLGFCSECGYAPADQASTNQDPVNQGAANHGPTNQDPANRAAANQGPANPSLASQTPPNQALANQASANQAPKSGTRLPAAGNRAVVPTLTIPPPATPSRVTGTVATRPQQTTGQGTGVDGVPLPIVRLPDLPSRILSDPRVPEQDRFCGKLGCGHPVGRSRPGRKAVDEGYCPECRSRFSFVPRLHPGDRVADRYEVSGCIARGGLGFVYLATDLRLHRHVALKGLIDVNNTAAVQLAENESQVLVALEHPNIVRIQDVVPHDGANYIVMEYVDGLSLREVKNRGRAILDAAEGRLLVEHVVVYGREILTALAYLHGQGLLYCDMKPDNVIHGERRVKLIDFGAIRRTGDRTSPWILTKEYSPPREELNVHGLTVRSDVYSVGKTLAELFNASDGHRPGEDRTPDRRPIAFGVRSLRHVLARATAPHDRRFADAREMLVQLDGVLNEILSLRDGESRPAFSTLFAEPTVLLDAGLGQPPPLEHWTGGRAVPLGALPSCRDIALGLPVPREDPHDDEIALLRTVRAPDAARLLKKLDKASPSAEVEFRRCRAWLEMSEMDKAHASLESARRRLGKEADHDWRVFWHEGLSALAAGHASAAAGWFEKVYHDIPGEETPKLALGLCAEHTAEDAGQFYDALWVHRSQVNAAFGLARVALARDDRGAAVRVLDEVPESSRHDEAARIAGVRVLAGVLPPDPRRPGRRVLPSEADLRRAGERMSTLDVEEQVAHRLRAFVLETVLSCHEDLKSPEPLCDTEPGETALRRALAKTLRSLAWHAPGRAEHEVLTDLANRTRPVTWI